MVNLFSISPACDQWADNTLKSWLLSLVEEENTGKQQSSMDDSDADSSLQV